MLDQEKVDEALYVSAEQGHTETVKLLLDAGVNVHMWDDAALYEAAAQGHTETVKLLLEAGADVHAQNDAALRVATQYQRTEVVAVLREARTAREDAMVAALRRAFKKFAVELTIPQVEKLARCPEIAAWAAARKPGVPAPN